MINKPVALGNCFQFRNGKKRPNSEGPIQKGIRMADLKRYSFALPTTSDMGKLTSLWAPLIRQIKNNEDVSDRLAELRDTLIPKLMNGEIDASTIDI